jgi:Icc-related predicted phosphoesterase
MPMAIRLFYATDIHGSETCFLKFINAAKYYKARVLIMGGDITGKMMVPIIKQSSGSAKTTFMDHNWKVNTEAEMADLMKHIRRSGAYPHVCSQEEYENISTDFNARAQVFTQIMVSECKRLVDLAEERLKRQSVKCYITPGNDDQFDIDDVFEGHEWIINPEGQVVDIDDHHQMISTGYANMTPWKCPRDILEEELRKKIEEMAVRLEKPESAIFNLHCPPYASQLDDASELDDNLTPVLIAGQIHIIPVGSTAVREAIEQWQPLAALHGHIHESRGRTDIGKTACFNAGSEYATGYLRGLILDLKKGKIKQYQLTSG